MHAQQDVIGFYENLGWVVVGELFSEADILHATMIKIPNQIDKIKNLKAMTDQSCKKEIKDFLLKAISKP